MMAKKFDVRIHEKKLQQKGSGTLQKKELQE
jgi:hypothetical protein